MRELTRSEMLTVEYTERLAATLDAERCVCGALVSTPHLECIEPCDHPSLTGIDQATGPDKVWRCDCCGALTRWEVIDGPLGRHVVIGVA